jgi:hypothetical protein
MAFHVSIPEGNRLIEVQYTGKVSTAQVYEAMAARSTLAQQHEIQDHLIECSQAEEVPDLFDLYVIAARIREIITNPICRTALVLPQALSLGTTLLFFIIRAAEHGVHIQLFTDRQEAICYLEST